VKESSSLPHRYYEENGYGNGKDENSRLMDASGVTFPPTMHTLILPREAVFLVRRDDGTKMERLIHIDWSTLNIPHSLRTRH